MSESVPETRTPSFRFPATLAGLMGAAGVILAALGAHKTGDALLGPASTMLLFHALATFAALLLVERRMVWPPAGLIAVLAFIVGALLFAGDLTTLQFAGHSLFLFAAPIGGTLLILGWIALAVAAARTAKSGA